MRLLNFFKKFWKSRKSQIYQPQKLLGYSRNMKKFDIVIITEDEGRQQQRQENGVFAESRQQLEMLYSMTGEKIRILREYDDPSTQKNPITEIPQNMSSSTDKSEISNENKPDVVLKVPQVSVNHEEQNQIKQSQYVVQKRKEPPKYFSICGTDCKFEDGKIYQKQWVKILGNEATQYRLISDSNNKEISLNGKHLEMLKWVLVQEENGSSNDLNNSIMQILNG